MSTMITCMIVENRISPEVVNQIMGMLAEMGRNIYDMRGQ